MALTDISAISAINHTNCTVSIFFLFLPFLYYSKGFYCYEERTPFFLAKQSCFPRQWLEKASSHSSMVNLLPMELLHRGHIGRRLSRVSLPPLDRARLCPAVKSKTLISFWHHDTWHGALNTGPLWQSHTCSRRARGRVAKQRRRMIIIIRLLLLKYQREKKKQDICLAHCISASPQVF